MHGKHSYSTNSVEFATYSGAFRFWTQKTPSVTSYHVAEHQFGQIEREDWALLYLRLATIIDAVLVQLLSQSVTMYPIPNHMVQIHAGQSDRIDWTLLSLQMTTRVDLVLLSDASVTISSNQHLHRHAMMTTAVIGCWHEDCNYINFDSVFCLSCTINCWWGYGNLDGTHWNCSKRYITNIKNVICVTCAQ